MASRRLEDLHPDVEQRVRAWVAGCAARGIDVLVYCTLRPAEEQAALYRQGRETPGPIVTNAPAWQSWHQYGRAIDAVPLRNGKPLWKYDKTAPEWIVFAEEAKNSGLEWAGTWKKFKEYVHLQWVDDLSLVEAYQDTHTT